MLLGKCICFYAYKIFVICSDILLMRKWHPVYYLNLCKSFTYIKTIKNKSGLNITFKPLFKWRVRVIKIFRENLYFQGFPGFLPPF